MNVHARGRTIKIENGIPFTPHKYPFELMEVGQSFFLVVNANTIRAAINRQNGRGDARFTYRKVTENGIHGVRVWRIK